MRDELVIALVAVLVVASLAVGYVAGSGARSTATSTFTSVQTITMVSTITSVSTEFSKITTTSTLTSTTTLKSGQPISIADIETANLSVGRSPGYLAVNPSAGRIYDAAGSSLIVIDASSHSVVANVTLTSNSSVSSGAAGIFVDPSTGTVFVSVGSGIAEVNGSTNAVVGELHLNSSLGALTLNPSTDTIYGFLDHVTPPFGGNGSIIGIDASTGAVVANLSLGYPAAYLALNPETNMIYAAGCDQYGLACNSMASIVNATSQTVVATVPLHSAYYSTMTYDAATNIVYVSVGGGLVALNGTSGAEVFEVNPETCGPFLEMGVIPSLDQVLMVPQNYDYLLVYNGTSGALANMYSYPSSPISIVYNPDTHEIYYTTGTGQFLAFPDFNNLGNVNATLIGAGETCLPV